MIAGFVRGRIRYRTRLRLHAHISQFRPALTAAWQFAITEQNGGSCALNAPRAGNQV